MGSRNGHMIYFLNFATPSISREWFEIETSNSACSLITGGTNDKNKKIGLRGSRRGHVTYFFYFGTLCISRERFELEALNLAGRLIAVGTNDKKIKNYVIWGRVMDT